MNQFKSQSGSQSTKKSLNRVKAIFKKEIKDSTRDRRALMMSMLPALLMPILMAFMFHTMAKTKVSTEDLTVQVIGQQNAPDLIGYLKDKELSFEDYQGRPKEDIQSKKVKLVLEIPDNYAEKFSKSEAAIVYIHSDVSLDKSRAVERRLNRLLQGYSNSIGTMRLMVRGVNPNIARAVVVEAKDYSTDASRAGQILASLGMIILLAAFFGSAPTAIDTTAGERERKSLEPLLVHPLSSVQIMLGKYFTVVSFGLLATIISVVITATALNFASLKSLGIDPKLTIGMQLDIIVMLVPMALLAASLQMLTSLFAKSFKEAQSYIAFISFIPVATVLATLIGGVKAADWMYAVPVLGQQQLLTNVLRGEGMDMLHFAMTSCVTVLLTIVIVTVLTRLLRSERVVYGA